MLNTERDGMENFEALLGLTNLAALNDKLRWVSNILVRDLLQTPTIKYSMQKFTKDRIQKQQNQKQMQYHKDQDIRIKLQKNCF